MKTAALGQSSCFFEVSERSGRAQAGAHVCGGEVELLLGTVWCPLIGWITGC